MRAKEGGKETTHGPLQFITSHLFRASLCHAKNEAPEEEAGLDYENRELPLKIIKEIKSASLILRNIA